MQKIQIQKKKQENSDIPAVPFEKTAEDRIVFSWMAPEYLQYKKSRKWYLLAAFAFAVIFLWGFLSGSWTMVLALAVFGGVYEYIHRFHPPRSLRIVISELGIRVGEKFYPFSHIQAFWIIYHDGLKTLNFRIAKHFFADLVIQLQNQDPVEIRHYLVTQIPEWEGKNEQFTDTLLRVLKL